MHKIIKFVPYRIDSNIAYDYVLWILYPQMSDLFKWIIVIVVLKQLSRLGYFYFLGVAEISCFSSYGLQWLLLPIKATESGVDSSVLLHNFSKRSSKVSR